MSTLLHAIAAHWFVWSLATLYVVSVLTFAIAVIRAPVVSENRES